MKKPLILLTNDDGYFAQGIISLSRNLKDLAEVFIVAPDRERSAASLSLTLHHPLRVKAVKKNTFAVEGTPADCVYLAVRILLPRKPDLVISGFNHGPNLGQQDISYSGTVAAATQGYFLEIPSLAVSLKSDEKKRFHFDSSAKIIQSMVKGLLKMNLSKRMQLNINIPPPPIKGIRIAPLGWKRYHPEIIKKTDPRKREYFWIGMGNPKEEGTEDSDVHVFKKGYVTVTPLQHDLTDNEFREQAKFQKLFKDIEDEMV